MFQGFDAGFDISENLTYVQRKSKTEMQLKLKITNNTVIVDPTLTHT